MDNKNETTCWQHVKDTDKPCKNKQCRLWLKCKNRLNCTIIAAEEGPKTLQEIGDLHSLTRMRICQIEKEALSKIKQLIFDS